MTNPNQGLYQRANSPYWHMRCGVNGREIRLSLKTDDLSEARKRRDRILEKAQVDGLDIRRSEWNLRCKNALTDSQSWLCRLWASANARNKRKGINRSISLSSVYRLAVKSGGRCAVTGIKFKWNGLAPERGPYAISLDRVRSSKPYSTHNCRMVLCAVNVAMNAWGAEIFWEIARHAVGRDLLRDSSPQNPAQRQKSPMRSNHLTR